MTARARTCAVAALTIAALGSVSARQSQQPQRLVLRGATVITGTGAAPIRDAVIVIEGETIRAVGGKETTYPADAMVMDLAGKFIIPGLVFSTGLYTWWKSR